MSCKDALCALYFPYPTVSNIDKMMNALLVFEHIYFIFPSNYHEKLEILYGGTNLDFQRRIKYNGKIIGKDPYIDYNSFSNFPPPSLPLRDLDELFKKDIFRAIKPADTLSKYREFMLAALSDDQEDVQFMKEKDRPNWTIDIEKIPEHVLDYPELKKFRGHDRIVLPFLIGESIMISHAVFACYSKEQEDEFISPMTDEPLHQELLRSRLTRGMKNLASKTGYAAPDYIRKAFEMALIGATRYDNVQSILSIRQNYQKPLTNLRTCIKRLAKVMQDRPEKYASEVFEINSEIQSAYMEMGIGSNLPKKMVYDTSDEYTAAIGGWKQTTIGINSEPNIRYSLITSSDTNLSTEATSDKSFLSTPTITLQVNSRDPSLTS